MSNQRKEVYVVGTVASSRITRWSTPEEVQKYNQTAKYPITGETYAYLAIVNPQVVTAETPQVKTLIESKFYDTVNKETNQPERRYSINVTKTGKKQLPALYQQNKATGKYEPIKPTQEIAIGQPVILKLSVFDTRYGTTGVGLDALLFQDEIKWYSPSSISSPMLAQMGIIIDDTQPAPTPEPVQSEPTVESTVQAQPVQPMVQPTQPVQQPVQTEQPTVNQQVLEYFQPSTLSDDNLPFDENGNPTNGGSIINPKLNINNFK